MRKFLRLSDTKIRRRCKKEFQNKEHNFYESISTIKQEEVSNIYNGIS